MKRSAPAISLTKPAHHQGIARGRKCVVVLLDEETVFPEIQSVFFQPAVIPALKYFPASAAHSVVHLGNAGLDRHAAILKIAFLRPPRTPDRSPFGEYRAFWCPFHARD